MDLRGWVGAVSGPPVIVSGGAPCGLAWFVVYFLVDGSSVPRVSSRLSRVSYHGKHLKNIPVSSSLFLSLPEEAKNVEN